MSNRGIFRYKIRRFISKDTALLIYTAMIRAHYDHGDFIVDSYYANEIDYVERLQDRIHRLME